MIPSKISTGHVSTTHDHSHSVFGKSYLTAYGTQAAVASTESNTAAINKIESTYVTEDMAKTISSNVYGAWLNSGESAAWFSEHIEAVATNTASNSYLISQLRSEVDGIVAEIVEEAKKHNPSLMIHVLINNADPRCTGENRRLRQFIEESGSFELLKTKLHRRADYRRAYSEGLSVCEFNPEGKACKEIRSLIAEITTLE